MAGAAGLGGTAPAGFAGAPDTAAGAAGFAGVAGGVTGGAVPAAGADGALAGFSAAGFSAAGFPATAGFSVTLIAGVLGGADGPSGLSAWGGTGGCFSSASLVISRAESPARTIEAGGQTQTLISNTWRKTPSTASPRNLDQTAGGKEKKSRPPNAAGITVPV